FQAEDGIRDRNVTGVQTCALPIFPGFTLLGFVGCSNVGFCPGFEGAPGFSSFPSSLNVDGSITKRASCVVSYSPGTVTCILNGTIVDKLFGTSNFTSAVSAFLSSFSTFTALPFTCNEPTILQLVIVTSK